MGITDTIKKIRISMLAAFQRIKPIQKNKILFWSDLGQRYACNPRYLSDYINNTYSSKYDIVWMFQATAPIPSDLPKGVRVVRYFSKEWLKEIATAKYIVCNHRIPSYFYFKKRKKQVYIQTWHGSVSLKSIEKDAVDNIGQEYIRTAIIDSKQIDYILSGCTFHTKLFQKNFWYNGKVLECGTPRVDFLLQNVEKKKEFLDEIGLDVQYRYILYAPTFRTGGATASYDIDFIKLQKAMKEKFGGEWKVLFRLHPNIAKSVAFSLPKDCIDVSMFHDMQKLLIATDVLITDYSSSMFDVAFLNKICFLYASDLEEYKKNERKLYFDVQALPFPLSQNNAELKTLIETFDETTYYVSIKSFMERIGAFENGRACEEIVDKIINGGNK